MRQQTVRVIALVVAVAMVLAAAAVALGAFVGGDGEPRSGGGGRAVPAPTSTPVGDATEPPSPDLARFYEQDLEWQACDDHECARLTVPVDYDDPDGETIELALLRVPATDPGDRLGSLVVNPGGPGAPGTTYAAQAGLAFGDALREHYDVVGFDPRGTGSSAPLDCLSDDALDAYLAADPDPDSSSEVAVLVDGIETLHAGCLERSGDLANHVTTVEAARDMDVLRAALGEPELDYFGASYGTKLGATYAELFPDRVGQLVLDGAVDTGLSSRELSLGQARGFETALRAYVEHCVAQGDCPLGDSVEAGLDRLQRFLAEVDRQGLPTSGDRSLRVGNAFYGLVAPLYNRDYWPLLTQALERAFAGDGSMLMLLSDAYSSRGPDGYLDNSSEAIAAINCLDDPYAVTPEEVPAQVPDFEEASPTFGRVFAWGLVGCLGHEAESEVADLEIDAAGAPPIVVIGTTRDPATPYEWAEGLAERLESGVLVTRDGDGHTGYYAGNECVDDAVEQFLVEEVVPEDGLVCS
ncbi:alpha/beta hydrolase [Nocardioides sp. SYSU DS0663]|uniref:alpha/beta hydrolase n=1 Tax=Nocardioides sp. SYSU DS0663 TaxID=3416445 RepID=UPI003F4BEFE3